MELLSPMITALIAATLMLAQAAALQAPSAPDQPPPSTVSPVVLIAPQPEKKKARGPDTIVCRNEAVLGSRMGVKRCSTVGQMAMDKFEAQEALTKMQAKDGYHH